MNVKPLLLIILSIYILLGSACNRKTIHDGYTDTPTTGKVAIAVDETFQPIIEAELPVFHAIYKFAAIQPKYVNENDAIRMLMQDSVRLAIISRPLKKDETNYFHARKIFPKEVPVAIDGIAVVVNPSNPDTLFSIHQLRKILQGEIKDWKQINPGSKFGQVKVVFDNPNSSIVRLVVDSIAKSGNLGKQLSAMEYTLDVVDFVAKNPDAIGLIGVSWISGSRDERRLSFFNKIKVASISSDDIATPENSYLPFQAYIATGKYPLTRFIYMILSEPRAGLGSGFTSFVASDKGQKIILKTGILPYTQPVRIVKINKE